MGVGGIAEQSRASTLDLLTIKVAGSNPAVYHSSVGGLDWTGMP